MEKHTNVLKEQRGLVSIIVTMFLMIMITLVVLGFARITWRDQRQVLDRQLSTQAFYAAESGVNDAIKVLQTVPAATTTPKTACQPDANYTNSGVLDAASGTAYTCLLVDPAPSSLQYDTIDTDKSTVIPINASGTVNSITLNWQVSPAPAASASAASCPGLGSLPTNAAYQALANCDAGMLRIELVPAIAGGSRANLMNTAFVAVFQPSNVAGPVNVPYGAPDQGITVLASCPLASNPLCKATITGLNASKYFLRIRSLYKRNSLTVTANNLVTGSLQLNGAQAVVDSTGKANDVLRRVVVRVKTSLPSDGIPDYAIQSRDSICKRGLVGTTGPGSLVADTSGLGIGATDVSGCQYP